ncbi:MAG: hypothetical protein IJC58_05950, partial [Oscillospiraceae bacterium]|nr:hypothetical protein [Oscillospiraceae bacterium]
KTARSTRLFFKSLAAFRICPFRGLAGKNAQQNLPPQITLSSQRTRRQSEEKNKNPITKNHPLHHTERMIDSCFYAVLERV